MLYYTTRFVDGLREDIHAVIVVQRPQNLDTHFGSIVGRGGRFVAQARGQACPPFYPKLSFKQALPFLYHQQLIRRPRELSLLLHRCPPKLPKTSSELCVFSGVCERCAEKWSCDHKCSAKIQLHAMQEVYGTFSL